MNKHDTVVPSSRRVVGLLFPGELSPILVVALVTAQFGRDTVVAARVVPQYRPVLSVPAGLPMSGFAGSGESGPDRVVCRPVLVDPGVPRRRQQRLE